MLNLNNLPDWVAEIDPEFPAECAADIEAMVLRLKAGKVVDVSSSDPATALFAEELNGESVFLLRDGTDVDFGGDIFRNGGQVVAPV